MSLTRDRVAPDTNAVRKRSSRGSLNCDPQRTGMNVKDEIRAVTEGLSALLVDADKIVKTFDHHLKHADASGASVTTDKESWIKGQCRKFRNALPESTWTFSDRWTELKPRYDEFDGLFDRRRDSGKPASAHRTAMDWLEEFAVELQMLPILFGKWARDSTPPKPGSMGELIFHPQFDESCVVKSFMAEIEIRDPNSYRGLRRIAAMREPLGPTGSADLRAECERVVAALMMGSLSATESVQIPDDLKYLDLSICSISRTLSRGGKSVTLAAEQQWPLFKELLQAGRRGLSKEKKEEFFTKIGSETGGRNKAVNVLKKRLKQIGITIPDARGSKPTFRLDLLSHDGSTKR